MSYRTIDYLMEICYHLFKTDDLNKRRAIRWRITRKNSGTPRIHDALFEDESYLKSQIEALKETHELFIAKYNPKAETV